MDQEQDLFDIDAGVEKIASGLGLNPEEDTAEIVEGAPEVVEPPVIETPVARAAPLSWPKDTHELWAKLDPKAQEMFERREKDFHSGLEQYKEYNAFGKQMREIFTPYKALLESQGVDEAKAAQYLLNAHYRLINLAPDQKLAYLSQLAKNYGINLGEQAQTDPRLAAIEQRLEGIVGTMAAKRGWLTRSTKPRCPRKSPALPMRRMKKGICCTRTLRKWPTKS